MPSDIPRIRYLCPKFRSADYHVLVRTLDTCLRYEISDIAKFRVRVLDHCARFGWRAAASAFNVKKSTLYDWKQRFELSGKRLTSLVPKSTRPHHTRSMVLDKDLLVFIRSMREQYGNVSKWKLKIFLDAYAKTIGVPSYGTNKIGKIIIRHRYFFDRPQKRRRRKAPLTPRIRHSPQETTPGYLEMDSITLYVNSTKLLFMTVIDVVTKVAWCCRVPSLASRQAVGALRVFQRQYPYPVRVVQTDNGSEFLGEFDEALTHTQVTHQFIYPRSPRINGVVERFNRTIQDEFLSRCDALYTGNRLAFEEKLVHYLTWYNTKRPHHSLKMKTPIAYLQEFQT